MLVQQIVHIQQTVLVPVIKIHLDLATLLDQILNYLLAKTLELDIEEKLKRVYLLCSFENIFERTVYLRLYFFQILNYLQPMILLIFPIQQLLKSNLREMNIQMHPIVQSQSQQHSHKLKSDWHLV